MTRSISVIQLSGSNLSIGTSTGGGGATAWVLPSALRLVRFSPATDFRGASGSSPGADLREGWVCAGADLRDVSRLMDLAGAEAPFPILSLVAVKGRDD